MLLLLARSNLNVKRPKRNSREIDLHRQLTITDTSGTSTKKAFKKVGIDEEKSTQRSPISGSF